MNNNFRDEVVARSDIHAIVNGRVPLIKQGPRDWAALCPFHNERSPSFTVTPDKGLFFCFGCGATGNAIDFVMKFDKLEFPAALDRVASESNVQKPDAPAPKKQGKLIATYNYADENGELLYQVCRYEPKDFRQRRPDGSGWRWSIKDVRKVPYNLPAMLAKPSNTVLIVEGEKDADNLHALGLLSTTNAGGSKNWPDELSQWFAARNVVILPDNDEPGRAHAATVAAKLQQLATSIRIVNLPGLPPKGDVSDWLAMPGNTPDELRYLCKQAPLWTPHQPGPEGDDTLIPARDDIDPSIAYSDTWTANDDDTDDRKAEAPFRALGFNDGDYFFLPHKTQQVVSIGSGSMTSASQMLTLAPLEFWEHISPNRNGADWINCGNLAMRWCEAQGTFDSNAIRGRGAWFDAGRSVLHLGNRLLVDRAATALHALESRFIYQRAPSTELGDIPPALTAKESCKLADIVQAMNWTTAVDRMLFAGFLVLAPVCGALAWRPHLWLTGQRGSGKSWALENIVTPLLGHAALVVQGNSTEAGIRQQLRQDARPIIFDEAEAESMAGRSRMQHVLELARQSSSDSHAQIAKGTASGKALTYRIRSMFLLGSINVGLTQAADRSRFSVLSLTKPDRGAAGRKQFETLSALVNATLTDDWCARLRARTYELIPTIRANAATFAKAAAENIGNQRAGDQIGTLLAGYYALHDDGRISQLEAAQYIAGLDWDDQRADEKTDSDESMLLAEILHAQIKIDLRTGSSRIRSIAELIQFLIDGDDSDLINDTAHDALMRHGVRYKDQHVWISYSHPEIRRILMDSPWAGGWGRILARVDGAVDNPNLSFAGLRHRAVGLPIAQVFGQGTPVLAAPMPE